MTFWISQGKVAASDRYRVDKSVRFSCQIIISGFDISKIIKIP